MLNDFLARLAIGILEYLSKRGIPVARDADSDSATLTRAGRRLYEWMRKQDDLGAGRQPDAGGASGANQGVPPG